MERTTLEENPVMGYVPRANQNGEIQGIGQSRARHEKEEGSERHSFNREVVAAESRLQSGGESRRTVIGRVAGTSRRSRGVRPKG